MERISTSSAGAGGEGEGEDGNNEKEEYGDDEVHEMGQMIINEKIWNTDDSNPPHEIEAEGEGGEHEEEMMWRDEDLDDPEDLDIAAEDDDNESFDEEENHYKSFKNYEKSSRSTEMNLRRNSLISNTSDGARDARRERRGLARYSGPLKNPLLRSRQFQWPDYRDQKLIDMAKEGWVTDPSQNPMIGNTIRRFFHRHGKADGVVVGQLPSELNDGHCIWHVVHNDGDSEDLSDDDLQICRQMYIRNDEKPQIPPDRTEYLYRSNTADMTYPIYRKSCQIGADFQVQVIPECRDINSEICEEAPVEQSTVSDFESVPAVAEKSEHISEALSIDIEAIISLPEYQDFQVRGKNLCLFKGVVTRYLGHAPTCQSPPSLSYLDLVCCVTNLPDADQYVIFDGTEFHTCLAEDLAQPYPDILHFPTIFSIHNCNVTEALSDLEKQLQQIIASHFTATQLSILQAYFAAWLKHGSNIRTSYARSSLKSMISFRGMISLYYAYLPYLSRNDENGCERIRDLYTYSFALRGVTCNCLSKSGPNDVAGVKIPAKVSLEDGDWGNEDDLTDIFFPNITKSRSEKTKSDHHHQTGPRKRVEQYDLETGELMTTYTSLAKAAEASGIEPRIISQCCNGKRSNAGGFTWKFQELPPPVKSRSRPSAVGLINRKRPSITAPSCPVREVQAINISTGEVVTTHSSIAAAALATGLTTSSIWKCCIGVDSSAGGFKWKFLDSDEPSSAKEAKKNSQDESPVEEEDFSDDETFHPSSIFERTGPKQVEQIDIDTGKILNIFPSGVAAGRAVGVAQKAISDCCHGRRLTVGGYRWRFHNLSVDDEEFYMHGGGSSEKSRRQYYPTGPKPVEQIDLKTGKVLKVFPSGADAAREYYISPNAISACCNGRRISAAGYQWRFAPPKDPPAKVVPPLTKSQLAEEQALRVRVSEASKPVLIPVQQLDIETGTVIQVYSSCIDAARSVGVHANAVFACCCGRRLFAGGYSWKFLPNGGPHSQNGPNVEALKKLQNSIDERARTVEQLDVRFRVLKEFSNVLEASKAVNIDPRLLAMCCRDQRLAGGFFWRFKNETPPPDVIGPAPIGGRFPEGPPRPLRHALLADIASPPKEEAAKEAEILIDRNSNVENTAVEPSQPGPPVEEVPITLSGPDMPPSTDPLIDFPPSNNVEVEDNDDMEREEITASPSMDQMAVSSSSAVATTTPSRHSNGGCEIEQIDPISAELIAIHPSFRAAGKSLGITPRSISLCVMGKRHLAGGFMWKYHSGPKEVTKRAKIVENVENVTTDTSPTKSENVVIPPKIVEETVKEDVPPQVETPMLPNSTEDQSQPLITEPAEIEDPTTRMSSRGRKRKSTADAQIYEYSGSALRPHIQPIRTPTKPADRPQSSSSSGHPTNRPQPVQQIDINTGEVIVTYSSRADAARSSGVCSSTIAACCKGLKPSAGGYIWKFCDIVTGDEGSEAGVENGVGHDEGEESRNISG